jgi:hypothetical protein
MPRPIGTPNLQIPDPPFVLEFGPSLNVILTPKQVPGEKKGEFDWEFDVVVEHMEGEKPIMSLSELQELELMSKLSVRWTIKMEREKEKLETQLEDLKKKLAFLQR